METDPEAWEMNIQMVKRERVCVCVAQIKQSQTNLLKYRSKMNLLLCTQEAHFQWEDGSRTGKRLNVADQTRLQPAQTARR